MSLPGPQKLQDSERAADSTPDIRASAARSGPAPERATPPMAFARFLRLRVFNMYVYPHFVLLGLLEGAILFSAVYVASSIRFLGDFEVIETTAGALWPEALAFACIMGAAMISTGLYEIRQRASFNGIVARVIVAFVVGATVLVATFYLLPFVRVWRGVAGLALVYSFLGICGTRYAFIHLVDQDVLKRRTLVYGAGKRAAAILGLRRRSDQRGFKIVGFVDVPGVERHIEQSKTVVPLGSLYDYARSHDIDEIVVAMDDRRRGFPISDLLDCRLHGIEVLDVLDFFERETGKVNVRLMNPSYLIFSQGFHRNTFSVGLKRLIDLTVSLILICLFGPLMLGISLAIWLEDRGSVFYRQVRTGAHGSTFIVLKFRSMREDAESEGRARWASPDDDRTTRVGAVLRKYRLDELPQLFNVLSGEMSLVGPRPERPEFVGRLAETIPYYNERHYVKPGITGWAQLRYPYGSSDHDALEKLQYDLFYVKKQNVVFDLMILLQTAEIVLWAKGAR